MTGGTPRLKHLLLWIKLKDKKIMIWTPKFDNFIFLNS